MTRKLPGLLFLYMSTKFGVSPASAVTLADIIDTPIMIYVESPEMIQKKWEARGHKSLVLGWTTWPGTPSRLCVIHVPPLTLYTFTIWLHEIAHCKKGRWHL